MAADSGGLPLDEFDDLELFSDKATSYESSTISFDNLFSSQLASSDQHVTFTTVSDAATEQLPKAHDGRDAAKPEILGGEVIGQSGEQFDLSDDGSSSTDTIPTSSNPANFPTNGHIPDDHDDAAALPDHNLQSHEKIPDLQTTDLNALLTDPLVQPPDQPSWTLGQVAPDDQVDGSFEETVETEAADTPPVPRVLSAVAGRPLVWLMGLAHAVASIMPPTLYTCSVCDEIYETKESLKDHQLTQHPGPEARFYRCNWPMPHGERCDYSTRDHKDYASNHYNTHTGLYQYMCPYCYDSFTANKNASRHMTKTCLKRPGAHGRLLEA